MIFEGYIVQFNEEKLSKILRLARNISGNINQIAVATLLLPTVLNMALILKHCLLFLGIVQ